MTRVAILGVGKLGESIAEGLLASGEIGLLYLVERSQERRQHAARRFRATVTVDPVAACRFSDVIVLAVKPGDVLELASSIATAIKPGQTVVSVAAGVKTERIKAALGGHQRVARVMPNLAVAVRSAVSGIYSENNEARELATFLFGLLGKAIVVPTEQGIDEMTALGASAPAFVAEFLSGLIAAGEATGLPEAREIILQMTAGTLKILADNKEDISEFVARVRTPGGTTAAGLEEFDKGGFRQILQNAVKASIQRATELDSEVP